MATHNHHHSHGSQGNGHHHPHNHKGDGKGGSDNHHGKGGNQKKGGNKDGGDKKKKDDKKGAQDAKFTFGDIGEPIKLDQQELRERAARETESAYAPLEQEIERQMTGSRQDAASQETAIKDIYGDFDKAIAPLDNQYQQQVGGIQNSYMQGIKGLKDMLGTEDVPAGELAAAGGLFANLGASGLSELSNAQSRNVGYNTSAQRQGSIESTTARANNQQELSDALEIFRQQAADARENQSRDTLNQLGTDRDTAFSQQLAQQELFLRQKALQAQVLSDKALSGYYTDLLGGKGGGGGGGGGGGDGNNHNNNHNNGNGNHNNGNGNGNGGNHRDPNPNGVGPHGTDPMPGSKAGPDLLLKRWTSGHSDTFNSLTSQQKAVIQDQLKKYLLHNRGAGPKSISNRDARHSSVQQLIHMINRKLYSGGGGGGGGNNGGGGGPPKQMK